MTSAQAAPKDAIAIVDGSYMKIGRFEKTFLWSGDEWIASEKSAADIIREVTRAGQNYEHDNRWLKGV